MFDGLTVQARARRVGVVEVFAARAIETGAAVEAHVFAGPKSEAGAWFTRVREISLIRSPGLQAIDHLGQRNDGTPYFVVTACTGVSLAQRIARDGPLAGSQVQAIASQLIASLEVAHHHGVAHCGLTLESCICMDVPGRHETMLLCGLASTGGRATQTTIHGDLGALSALLVNLVDPAQDPELAATFQEAGKCQGFAQFAQMLTPPRRQPAIAKRMVFAGALVGLVASAFGASWWLSQR